MFPFNILICASASALCSRYFWNAALYHLIMDGFSGTFSLVPLILNQYHVLDRRFITHHSVPWSLGLTETFFHTPLCLAAMWTILRNHPLRYPLELIVATLHFYGMVMFTLPEIYEGQLNVPANDPIGVAPDKDNGIAGGRFANAKWLDMNQLTYYWFGFCICNLVWAVVPYYRATRSIAEIHQRFAADQGLPSSRATVKVD